MKLLQDCECGTCIHEAGLTGLIFTTWLCMLIPKTQECCKCESSCFPAAAKCFLENGESVTMSELKLGDQVQTGILFQKTLILFTS